MKAMSNQLNSFNSFNYIVKTHSKPWRPANIQNFIRIQKKDQKPKSLFNFSRKLCRNLNDQNLCTKNIEHNQLQINCMR